MQPASIYIVPIGTRVGLVKPDGQKIDPYTCRRNTSFAADEMRRHNQYYLEFRRNGWMLKVPESRVIVVEVKGG